MQTKTESGRVAEHVANLPKSPIREFFSIVANTPGAISLGIGEPDFITPWNIRESAIYALESGHTSYTDNRGLAELRQAIHDYVCTQFLIEYNPESEILVTIGISEAIDIALRALISPGDKVMYHEPCYVSYFPGIRLAHGIPIPVATHAKDNFALTREGLENAWEPGCKALLLNFPTNPTGGTVNRESLEGIAAFAIEKDLVIISDEIYAELTYEGTHTSIASLPGMRERTIFLHGFSKNFAMTGFRVGYACGPEDLIGAMLRIHQYSILCAPILSQKAAIEALKNGSESVLKMRDEYMTRRDYIVNRFNAMGLPCHLPHGTFYTFPSVANTGLNEVDFAYQLLQEEQVAVIPGSAFGPSGAGFVRATFATGYNELLEASNRIERFLEHPSQ